VAARSLSAYFLSVMSMRVPIVPTTFPWALKMGDTETDTSTRVPSFRRRRVSTSQVVSPA